MNGMQDIPIGERIKLYRRRRGLFGAARDNDGRGADQPLNEAESRIQIQGSSGSAG
jgi:hypothetical protein